MKTRKTILELRGVGYAYPDKTLVLKNISLKINEADKICVLGGNGAGKSTLFLLLNGVYKISDGELYFQDRKIAYSKSDLMNLRKHTGIVFQDPETQIFSSSVYEEISFGLINLGYPENEIKIKVDRVLDLLNIAQIKDKPTHFLSYGEKKKVSIADILVMDPEIYILDEPDACLDPVAVKNLTHLLDDLHSQGKMIIMSTQDVNLAYSWANRIIVMKEGKILKDGSPLEIFSDSELIKSASLEKPIIHEILNELNLLEKFPKNMAVTKTALIEYFKGNLGKMSRP